MTSHADPDRARQIRRLFRLGMSVQAATDAVDADRVTMALVDHLIGGGRDFTREEAAGRAGLSLHVAETIDRVAGVGDDARYSESGIHHLALIARLLQVLPEEEVLEQIRADIPILRALALRTLDTARTVFIDAARRDHPDPVDAGVALSEVAKPLLDLSSELVGASYRRVILELMTSDIVVESLRSEGETVDVAVGFVDVVGYTSLSARVDPSGLDEVLTRFESDCQAVVEAHPAVSLVKFMGDAGMFVALDPVELATALFGLVSDRADDDEESIPTSAGIAHGPALLRGGDYFGPPVNEAARLTDLARRHSVLVSDQLKEPLSGDFDLRRLAPVSLHGIGRRRPYALRRAQDDG
ncbi:Adenylate cyclase [Euzebya pacifica]|uniref:Adenylate cyclase n=1 Tax=Euzebya pacifica TaxID=1608957 RepID=A0A346XTJ6_9ACTN|nr:adenylate/guanylate cyclase domain-containing protein [Euzebya pacifica]AXV05543.1 Adenylate cyclase [Euzebya pacifica]